MTRCLVTHSNLRKSNHFTKNKEFIEKENMMMDYPLEFFIVRLKLGFDFTK